MRPAIEQLHLWALKALELRVPYVWGGKDPQVRAGGPYQSGGLDCSGFITYGLHLVSGPDWRTTHNTDLLWTRCPRVPKDAARLGDAVLYWGQSSGPDDVSHVMLYLGGNVVVGQPFGGPANTSAGYSLERGHTTKALPIDYRPDIAGFVRLPIPGQP
jgi:murein DD-endopeptidase